MATKKPPAKRDPLKLPPIDIGSFTGPERRNVQERFGVDFRQLNRYFHDRMFGDGTMPTLQDPNGKQIFADEILQAFYYEQIRRERDDIDLEDLDELDFSALLRLDSEDEEDPKAEPSSD